MFFKQKNPPLNFKKQRRILFVFPYMSQTISRVMSRMIIYLVLLLPTGSSDLPVSTTGSRIAHLLVLLRVGFTEPILLPK